MQFQIQSPRAIQLPGWIGESTLTLAEIGAIAVLLCLESGKCQDTEMLLTRIGTPEMADIIASLRNRGVLHVALSADGESAVLKIDIAFESLEPSPDHD